jgi:predicted TIM-barrel enzyme
MPRLERQAVLTKFQMMKKSRKAAIGGGAGTGLSAKYEEAEGIDLIVIYNSGCYRMAGRGALVGLRPPTERATTHQTRRVKAIVFEKRATKEML